MADIGLVQWTPKSSLIQHASILGFSNYDDGDTQLYVIANEMTGNPSSILEWYSSQAFVSRYYNSGATQDMIGISGLDFYHNTMDWTPSKLAVAFMVCYERPSYDPSINHYQAREQYASNWFQFMGGITPIFIFSFNLFENCFNSSSAVFLIDSVEVLVSKSSSVY